jgi:hypothetical protein
MNIAVMMASRGNQASLQAVLTSSAALASGQHAVTYVLGIDDDDSATSQTAAGFSHPRFKLHTVVGHKPNGMGELFNRLVASTAADVYIHVTDRTFFLTPRWDLVIAEAIIKTCPYGVFWLTDPDLPRSCIFPAISRRWLQASGSVFTDYFPFWFDDTWLAETWLFATGAAPLMLPIHAWRQPHKTAKLRDLDFWYRFFFALRPMRMQAGGQIALKLGLRTPDQAAIRAAMEASDRDLLARVPQIEAEYGAPGGNPDSNYLTAKGRAEAILASLPKATG